MQNQRQLFGYGAAVLLALATFLPIATLPLVGSLNYFANGQGDGVFVLISAAIAGTLIALKRYKLVLIPAGIAIAVTLFTFINLLMKINEMKAGLSDSLEGNPFSELAQGLAASVQLEWGWFILFLAEAALVLVAFNVLPRPKPSE